MRRLCLRFNSLIRLGRMCRAWVTRAEELKGGDERRLHGTLSAGVEH